MPDKKAETKRTNLTLLRIKSMEPPVGKQARYVYDENPRCLCVRITPAGAKSFVFAGKLDGIPIRLTIGATDTWLLDAARDEAKRLQVLVDQGIDPRQERAEKLAASEAKRADAAAAKLELERLSAPAIHAWAEYVKERKEKWSASHLRDHERLSQEGGAPISRGKKTTEDGTTQQGILRPLLLRPLAQIDAVLVQSWLKAEVAKHPTQAALAFRLLRAFVNWAHQDIRYKDVTNPLAHSTKKVREELPQRGSKDDCLQREQLKIWFAKVRAISNPVISAYLQIALLTGARREEVARMRWEDIDFQWKTIRIGDKVEAVRTIPLTPYVAALLRDLKRRNNAPPAEWRILNGRKIRNDLEGWKPSPWVFSSPRAEAGYLQEPRIQHQSACADAGIGGLTIHGLRRSFASLTEWCEVPVGVVAQIMGHKPSATAERHYKKRPIDLIRQWHTKIEAWILAEAHIKQTEINTAPPAVQHSKC